MLHRYITKEIPLHNCVGYSTVWEESKDQIIIYAGVLVRKSIFLGIVCGNIT